MFAISLSPFIKLIYKSRILWFVFLLSSLEAYTQGDLYSWAKWSQFTDTTATGTIYLNDQAIQVTMSSMIKFHTTPGIYNYRSFSKFNSIIPDSTVPETTWAIREGVDAATSMCFSQTVSQPVMLLSSIGHAGYPVWLKFSKKYIIVYNGGGMIFNNDSTLTGAEGNAIIAFPGTVNCIEIACSRPEVYTNISWALGRQSSSSPHFMFWVIPALGVIALLAIFFIWRKRKERKKEEEI